MAPNQIPILFLLHQSRNENHALVDLIQEVKDMQGAKLQPYDWYITRKADDGTAVPSAVQTYRDGVRTKATEHETAVAATTTVDELIAVNIGDGWPDEPS